VNSFALASFRTTSFFRHKQGVGVPHMLHDVGSALASIQHLMSPYSSSIHHHHHQHPTSSHHANDGSFESSRHDYLVLGRSLARI
jgi:hypothetical protein